MKLLSRFRTSRFALPGLLVVLALAGGAILPTARAQDAPSTTQAAPPQNAATSPVADVAAPVTIVPKLAERPTVGDAAGATTGVIDDAANASGPMTSEMKAGIAKNEGAGVGFLGDAIGQNRVAINMVWLILCGTLVMFMQAGFALVETGFTRAKNATHTFMLNFGVYFLGMLGYWVCGFALQMGNAGTVVNLGGTAPLAGGNAVAIPGLGTIFALKGFFLSGDSYDVGVYALFLFQMVFMDAMVTIPTGAMAERFKFSAFIPYCFFGSMLLYPVMGHWAWGGGWLSQIGNTWGLGCGYVDFAGSGVVHAMGGFCGLAGAMVLGPRIGKFNKDGSGNAIPGHNIPLALLGAMILAFGWFGFNAGSTLGASGAGNLRIGVIATNTMLASAAGGFIAMLITYWQTRRPDPTMVANGFLGGLVAITAPCAFVGAPISVIIGAIAGALVCFSVAFVDKLFVDDPVGAISVHGVCGSWGLIAVGLFADGVYGNGWNGTAGVPLKGLLMGGGFGQLGAQLVGLVTIIVWAFGLSLLFFKALDAIMGIRSRPEDEIIGLDVPEMGVLAYPTFPTETEMELSANYIEA